MFVRVVALTAIAALANGLEIQAEGVCPLTGKYMGGHSHHGHLPAKTAASSEKHYGYEKKSYDNKHGYGHGYGHNAAATSEKHYGYEKKEYGHKAPDHKVLHTSHSYGHGHGHQPVHKVKVVQPAV